MKRFITNEDLDSVPLHQVNGFGVELATQHLDYASDEPWLVFFEANDEKHHVFGGSDTAALLFLSSLVAAFNGTEEVIDTADLRIKAFRAYSDVENHQMTGIFK